MTETQMLFAAIISNHNANIINKSLETLKQFAEDGGSLYIYNKNGNSFKFTPDTEWVLMQNINKNDGV